VRGEQEVLVYLTLENSCQYPFNKRSMKQVFWLCLWRNSE